MGIYQLRFLDRIPPHAAVNESVELVKQAHRRSAAGFVNALLRQAVDVPLIWPDRAVALCQPAWLLDRWEKHFGRDIAETIARAFLEPPAVYVHIPHGTTPDSFSVEPTDVEGCFKLLSGQPQGFRIQDIGSQSIVSLLELQEGHRFLDLCAAPGNKTAQALEKGVWAVACDIHPVRLSWLKQLPCNLVVLDATQPLPFCPLFDRILLDAPCSGTGTLGRNPEIRWRLRETDLAQYHKKQVAMLSRALEVLAPGGKLVYSTCSLEPEENDEVVMEVLGSMPEKIYRRLPGKDPGDGFFAVVIPSG